MIICLSAYVLSVCLFVSHYNYDNDVFCVFFPFVLLPPPPPHPVSHSPSIFACSTFSPPPHTHTPSTSYTLVHRRQCLLFYRVTTQQSPFSAARSDRWHCIVPTRHHGLPADDDWHRLLMNISIGC